MRPPLVYIAGPYSAPTPEETQANVDRAIDAGNRLMDAGLRVRVPHLSHYQHARKPRPYREWMDIDADEVRRCDILLRLEAASPGADEEVQLARERGMPVYFSEVLLLAAWRADLEAQQRQVGEALPAGKDLDAGGA